jgi:hypothetical protein
MSNCFLIKALENHGAIRENRIYFTYPLNDNLIHIYIQDYSKVQLVTLLDNSFKYETITNFSILEEHVVEMLSGRKFHVYLTDINYYKDLLPNKIHFDVEQIYDLLSKFGKEISIAQSILLSNLATLYSEATFEGDRALKNIRNLSDPYFLNKETKFYVFLSSISLYMCANNLSNISTQEVVEQYKSYESINSIERFSFDKMSPIFKEYFNFLRKSIKN